jgi:hypothetical protein
VLVRLIHDHIQSYHLINQSTLFLSFKSCFNYLSSGCALLIDIGKTSLMCCFADDGSFSPSMISTAGVDCRVKAVKLADHSTVSLQIWDTAGFVHVYISFMSFVSVVMY